jgi:hypothetical protein
MQTARDSLGKQAGILEKNAAVFDRISDRLGRVGAKIRGFFIGAGAGLAGIVDNLTARLDKVDLAPFGEKVAAALKKAMKLGFMIWEDPMGVMGLFWAIAKAKAKELANWLHDAIEGAFPGMAVAIEDAISKTVAWGKILIGYAIQFGDKLLGAAQGFASWITAWWESSGIPELLILLKNYVAKPIVSAVNEIASDPVAGILKYVYNVGPEEKTTFDLPKRWKEEAARDAAEIKPLSEVFPDMMSGGKGEDTISMSLGERMVADGMAQLAKKASGAAEALEKAKIGADHFGAADAWKEVEELRAKLAPAENVANAQMAAIGGREGKLPFTNIFQNMQSAHATWFNDPTRTRIRREGETRARIDRERNAVYKGPLGRREFEAFRNMAQANGLTEIDGVPVRREGEVRRGDAARRKAFEKDQERKRLKGLTEKETLDELLNVAKDARDANKKVAKAIAE